MGVEKHVSQKVCVTINIKDQTCQVLQTFLETRIVSFVSSILRGSVVVHRLREHVRCSVLEAPSFGGNMYSHEMFVKDIAQMSTR